MKGENGANMDSDKGTRRHRCDDRSGAIIFNGTDSALLLN